MTQPSRATGPNGDDAQFVIINNDSPPIEQVFTPQDIPFTGTVETTGFTEEEAYRILTGQPINGFTAAVGAPDGDDDTDEDVTGERTGAMIALMPTALDADRLTLTGGEPTDQLHLTLLYLGQAADYSGALRQAIRERVAEVTMSQVSVTATGFGAAVWNPEGATPALVLNVGEGCIQDVKDAICREVYEVWGAYLPEQHEPWVPHICLQYSPPGDSVSAALGKVGPITFDRVRVAFAGDYVDFPLLVDTLQAAGPNEGDMQPIGTETLAVTGAAQPPVGNTDLPGTTGMYFEGVIVVEGVPTGDGRQFAPGSLTWADLVGTTVPLRWAPEDFGEHQGAVSVGRIDQIWRDPTNPAIIHAAGMYDLGSDAGAEASRRMGENFLNGVSVDVDSVSDADVEYIFPDTSEDGDALDELFAMPELTIFHAGRIRGATLVDIPAFTEAVMHLTDGPMMAMPTETPTASGSYAVSDGVWQHTATMNKLGVYVSEDVANAVFAVIDRTAVRMGGIHVSGGHFLHHEITDDGKIGSANLTACTAALGKLLSDTKVGLNMAQRRMAYEHLAQHVRDAGLRPQEFTVEGMTEVLASAAEGLEAPGLELFGNPNLDEPTGLTVVTAGAYQHIFGHAALWETCHTSFPGTCVTPPFEDDHTYFRLGEVLCASGDRIPVGAITLGTGHAATFGVDAHAAMEHYDNTGTCVALVASGNDDHGIWVAGIIKPGTPQGRIMELGAAKLSGDWRRIGGQLRLVAMLAVNTPGFPVPRLKTHVNDGKQLSLVASGIVNLEAVKRQVNQQAMQDMAHRLQRKLGRDPQTLATQLRTRVMGVD